jgi:hypothetical protein
MKKTKTVKKKKKKKKNEKIKKKEYQFDWESDGCRQKPDVLTDKMMSGTGDLFF